ncbi:hypothetical protein [Leptospira sp. GIMC2001]|uniref:hypothetical protein n=1 Tax=Leptospira sp. GIMC2001 TaxID=1513297 RepID=UPI00234BD349|nr:hypothetical protein [Leptospira sp. GIMC2001]WCL48217.1 hypothetical protein O4O04_12980 [Leptospira sp. GIMC2001]
MIIALVFNCASLSFLDQKPIENIPINPNDSLAISKIVKLGKDGKREILATSPEAMRYIFYRAGCSDGTSLAGLLKHEWKEDSKIEEWTGACRSLISDVVRFRISHPGDRLKYQEFGEITQPMLIKAENEKNVSWFYKAIEREPALADARLNLFRDFAEKKNCKAAKRNLSIFLLLSPKFQARRSLEQFMKQKCG